jgi:hypothetical protein
MSDWKRAYFESQQRAMLFNAERASERARKATEMQFDERAKLLKDFAWQASELDELLHPEGLLGA